MVIICGKLHWNHSKWRDIASCGIGINRCTTHGQTDDWKTRLSPSVVGIGGQKQVFELCRAANNYSGFAHRVLSYMMDNWFHSSQWLLTRRVTQQKLYTPRHIIYKTFIYSNQIQSKVTVYFFTAIYFFKTMSASKNIRCKHTQPEHKPFWRQMVPRYRQGSVHCLVQCVSWTPCVSCLLVNHTCQPRHTCQPSCLTGTGRRRPDTNV